MLFQRSDDLEKAPTDHLFNLRLELMGHSRTTSNFQVLISKELNERREELKKDEYQWIRKEICDEAEELAMHGFDIIRLGEIVGSPRGHLSEPRI